MNDREVPRIDLPGRSTVGLQRGASGPERGRAWKCPARHLSVQTRPQACVRFCFPVGNVLLAKRIPWGSNSRRRTPRSLPARGAVAATFGPATTTLGRTRATPATMVQAHASDGPLDGGVCATANLRDASDGREATQQPGLRPSLVRFLRNWGLLDAPGSARPRTRSISQVNPSTK